MPLPSRGVTRDPENLHVLPSVGTRRHTALAHRFVSSDFWSLRLIETALETLRRCDSPCAKPRNTVAAILHIRQQDQNCLGLDREIPDWRLSPKGYKQHTQNNRHWARPLAHLSEFSSVANSCGPDSVVDRRLRTELLLNLLSSCAKSSRPKKKAKMEVEDNANNFLRSG